MLFLLKSKREQDIKGRDKMWFDSFTHDSSIDIDNGRNARDDDDEGDND